MVKTVIVPLDRSPVAASALAPACWVATRVGAPLHLITATLSQATARDKEYLVGQAEALDLVDVTVEVIEERFPAPAIAGYIEGVPEPLVCMATHGRSGFGTLILGSVADLVLREVTAPVMLVGPNARTPGADGPLVVCWDGSARSRTIVPTARSLAAALGLDICLLTVITSEANEPDLELSTAFHVRLEHLAADLRTDGAKVRVKVLDSMTPAEAIVRFATSEVASLVVSASQGHGGEFSTALGRVVGKVVRLSPVPVVVQRPLTA